MHVQVLVVRTGRVCAQHVPNTGLRPEDEVVRGSTREYVGQHVSTWV